MFLGLEKELYPKTTFFFARKQVPCSHNQSQVRDLDLSCIIGLKKKTGLSFPLKILWNHSNGLK